MDRLGVTPDTADEILVAVTELATNAVEASPDGAAQVEAAASDGRVQIEIANDGPPFSGGSSKAATEPTGLPERGRGLDIVDALVDAIHFGRVDGRTTIAITKAY
jgi:anti-sigma regulatory factor (Ser/Thr protein kinase)